MKQHVMALALILAACSAEQAPAPPDNDATPSAATTEANAVASKPAVPAKTSAHPCQVQDGARVRAAAIRAIGTEPFWGAQTDGRCVTYSTPEDQAGTRIWTKARETADGSVWTGALRGKTFELSIRTMPDCSDGMSDNRYPLEAKLLVDGEERRGCAREITSGR